MAFIHGKNGVIKIGDVGNVVRDWSTYVTSVSSPTDIDEAETTTLQAGGKTFLPGLAGATLSIEGIMDPTVIGWINGIISVAGRTFEWGPGGSATGMPRVTGTGFLTSYEPSGGVDDVARWSVEFRFQTVPARDVYP